jgi:hypothetical protein
VSTDELRGAGEWQAGYCRELGAPTWAAVIDALLSTLDGPSAAAEILRADDGDVYGTMRWLRFLGAVHRLALDDPACELASVLPSAGGRSDPAAAARTVPTFVAAHGAHVVAEMQFPVQTNEVARGAALSAAMGWLGGPLRLREVGASAGLNLWLDRCRVVGDGFAWGPLDAAMHFDGLFATGTPAVDPFSVIDRAGCDRHPLDVRRPEHRRLLRSFVWPDHLERLARLDAAIDAAGPMRLDDADLVAWTGDELATLEPGRTVVYHSIVVMYLDLDAQRALAQVLDDAGARATDDASLAHVSFELGDHDAEIVVRRWPERDVNRLATLSPHGGEVHWRVEALPWPRSRAWI